MIRSMTGYGREQAVLNGREILVEIRSVNHRFYELTSRIPRAYSYIEEHVKSLLHDVILRGKVEVSITINGIESKDIIIKVNSEVAKGYVDALREANQILGLADNLSLSEIMRFPDVFTVRKDTDDEEEIWNDVKQIASSALEKFISMREREGYKLKEDILSRLDVIEKMLSKIETAAPALTENYRNKLFSKLCDVLNDSSVDEQRILTEAAVFAEKTAVDEETVRLHSHVIQFRELMDNEGQVGRKLDFLIQEMNREINTIGSKVQDLEITRIVVNLKSELEKIREQIQNIE